MTKLLSIENTAQLLSISPWTVRKYIACGRLQPVRIGRRVLVAETEIERFVAQSQSSNGAGEVQNANS